LGRRVGEFYEAGAALEQMPVLIPSSSTDYDSYADTMAWRGTTAELLGMVPRLDAVFLDAAAVDVRGCVNSFGEGRSFRSAGGGGSADVAARARRLVLQHGGTKPTRIEAEVSAVTAAPHPDADVRLVTRWGLLQVGDKPALLEFVPGGHEFVDHLRSLGVDTTHAVPVSAPTEAELAAASAVLTEAGPRG
jgi:glutaconate CoA-transferase subunit B